MAGASSLSCDCCLGSTLSVPLPPKNCGNWALGGGGRGWEGRWELGTAGGAGHQREGVGSEISPVLPRKPVHGAGTAPHLPPHPYPGNTFVQSWSNVALSAHRWTGGLEGLRMNCGAQL